MSEHQQRTVVITGASRGLGRAMAVEFAALGHAVHGCCRSAADARSLAAATPESCRFVVADVTDDAAVGKWAAEVSAHSAAGAADLLLNNAGVMNDNAPLWEVPPEEFSSLVDINIKGTFYVLRHFVPPMVARRAGVIVNFSSGWGRSASPEVAPYCASKWAIEGLTRALAMELPQGVAAVPLNPGVIHTEMLERCFGKGAASYPSPQQWARRAVPFLLDLSYDDSGDPLTAPGG